jgi:hypothetical protein
MRYAIGAIGVLFCASTAFAQAIDIGGVAVRIGDDAATAMKNVAQALPSEFSVGRLHIRRGSEPEDTTSEWIVSKSDAPGHMPSTTVATVSVKEGLISWIAKYYDIRDGSDIATVYTAAMRDARRDAFQPCTTSLVRLSHDVVQVIRTVCGSYQLDFNLSWTNKTGLGRSATSIAVIVSAAKSGAK